MLEVLLSALDARESAREIGAPMLIYLSDLMVARAKEELEGIRTAIERIGEGATNGDP